MSCHNTTTKYFALQHVQRVQSPGALTHRLHVQVHADFEWISKAYQLSTLCLYGGSPYQPQESALRRGVDIVVGTPGRVKDHLQRNTLKMTELQ